MALQRAVVRLKARHRIVTKKPAEMRRVFPSLDNFKYKDKWWVIDIGGNNLRMISFIQFMQNRMYVKYIVSHAEYDKLTKRYAKGELK